MTFDDETFITLDLPEPFAAVVMAVRERHRDEDRGLVPAHVTLAGSGGVGVVAIGQDRANAFSLIDGIASATAPVQARFGPVVYWPPSYFVLTYTDDGPIRGLHIRLARSGIRFVPAEHPFVAHTTVRSRPQATRAEREALLALAIPGDVRFEAISVYEGRTQAPEPSMRLTHSVRLSGS